MGIPSYFRHLLTNYNDIVFPIQKSMYHFTSVDRLYFDLNCAIHPCAKKIADTHTYSSKKKDSYEMKIIMATIEYIITIISVVQPTKLVYIAIDGVAPRAKMEQQRSRRFKSVKEKEIIKSIKKKYDKNYVESELWDTNAITPGTPFMETLSNALKQFIKEHPICAPIEVIFSNANCPGEGEHKIMNYIKSHTGEYIDVIYGLDADLIMLSLIRNQSSIYLLRERIHFGKSIDIDDVLFVYLDIARLRSYLITEFHSQVPLSLGKENENRFIDDYIFMCFLLGNDFIPHSPSLSIKENGIQMLVTIYGSLYLSHKEHLIDRESKTIHHQMLFSLLSELSKMEDTLLQKKTRKIQKYRINYMKCNSLVERKLEEFSRYPLYNKQIYSQVKMGQDNWMERYYHTFFLLDRKQYRLVCKNFFEALIWTFHYYFGDCISWGWYYKYRHAPSFKDMTIFLKDDICDVNKIRIRTIKPYTPCRQLFTVLPPKSSHLLPASYRKLICDSTRLDIARYYPIDYEVDTLFSVYYWQCLPILPIVDDTVIYRSLKQCKLTNAEKRRNRLEKNCISPNC